LREEFSFKKQIPLIRINPRNFQRLKACFFDRTKHGDEFIFQWQGGSNTVDGGNPKQPPVMDKTL